METIVGKLKIGSRLILGAYSVNPNRLPPPPIKWLKCNKENEFISEHVLDYLIADKSELAHRTDGRPSNDYWTSNIVRWLESPEFNWYVPAHNSDLPPHFPYPNTSIGETHYKDKPGFLAQWDLSEIALLDPMRITMLGVTKDAIVRLPTVSEICKTGMTLFHRKGVRATASDDAIQKMYRQGFNYYVPYWLNPRSGSACWNEILPDASQSWRNTNDASGIRPIIKVKFDTPVRMDEHGNYIPISTGNSPLSVSDADISKFLGLA